MAGDVHGNTTHVRYLIDVARNNDCDRIFQLGDFGAWEHMSDGVQFMDKVANYARKNQVMVYFLDGNHDKTSLLMQKYGDDPDDEGFLKVRNWIRYSPRGHRWIWDEVTFISLGGAYSVDKDWRVKVLEAQGSGKPERYWFPEEEMADEDMAKILLDITPVDVMLAHDNVVASIESFHRIIPPMDHRLVSLLPLSHLLEQAVGLYYALDVGADILYVRSRNPRVIFDALRDQQITSMVVVPQVLDLFWSAIEREVAKRGRTATFERLRGISRRLPVAIRRLLFRTVHQQLGGHFRLFLSSGAFLPPALQQAWEDIGVTVLQGYGATETGTGSCTTLDDHGLGTVGRVPEGIEMRLAPDGEIQFRGRTVFKGYWNAPELTKAAFTDDGWYRTGDLGRFDDGGRLILSGRLKDMIVLPNGFNVYPEDIENALRIAGVRDAVVLETDPGRIEAIVLALEKEEPAGTKTRIEAAVKAANGTLGPNQRIAAWRLWPGEDFPRTHTLKIKRDPIRQWVAAEPR